MTELKAVIFDLDGTLLDNNSFHYDAWKKYLEEKGMEISDEAFKEKISGRTNMDAVQKIFNKKMTKEEAETYYLKKEEIYRELYKSHITPVAGLIEFLEDLQAHNIAMAIATSGIRVNIDFMFAYIAIEKYFKEVIDSSDITKGKPDPQIFLKTAEALNILPENCIVFEDSTAGLKAGKAAGMKVIALTTTHKADELKEADMLIKDYTEMNFERLISI